MRCRDILNPKHQYQCQVLRQKAMHANEPLSDVQWEKLLKGVAPPKLLIEKAKFVINISRNFLKFINVF